MTTDPFTVIAVPGCTRHVKLTIATADTGRLIRAALWGLREIYKPGFRYKKTGVLFLDLDTGSDFKEIVLAVFGVVAKLEHRRIIDFTTRGRAAAKARGVIFGRKPKLAAHQQREARARLAKGDESLRAIALSYGVSHSTISCLRLPEADA